MKEILTVEDLAAELQVTPRAVRKMIARHQIPAARLGKRWLVRRDAFLRHLQDLEEARSREASDEAGLDRVVRAMRTPKVWSGATG